MASVQSPSSPQNGNNDDDSDEVLEITPIDNYNALEGKMQASMSWLIAKVYGSNVPDQLVYLFTKDKEKIALKPLVVQCLVSGELYCSAASTIFHDSALINQSHGTVLQALHRYQIDVVDGDTGVSITETMLRQDAPFKLNAHLAMIDGLMTAHMREVISVERVVESVKKYTNVHRNEQPVDIEDAILFWINKICATVRDNLGYGKQNNQEAPLIPEMDDLYEDICDGTCAATVVHFYHPNNLPFHEICFNDPISIGDMAHNLRLLRRFCQRYLPWNIFHFSLEDILYMHESLKPNVNAFFADLFYLLEVHQDVKSSARTQQAKSKVRGLPEKVAEIPNLRSGSSGSATSSRDRNSLSKPTTKPAVPSAAMLNLRRDTTAMNSLATSRLASTDSLATNRSEDSLRYRPYVGSNTESPLTGTGSSPSSARNFQPLQLTTTQNADNNGQYQRSDSMPVRPGAPSAAIRLQLEQKRRQYEQQRMQQGSKLAEERQQRSKEAFFTLLGKSLSTQQMAAAGQQHLHHHGGAGSSFESPSTGSPSAASLLRKKATTPTAEMSPSIIGQPTGRMGGGGNNNSTNLNQLAEFSKSIHELRQEMKRLSIEQEKLTKIMEPTPVVVSLGIGTGSPPPTMTYVSPNYGQFQMSGQHQPGGGAQFQVSAPMPSPYAAASGGGGQFTIPSPGLQQQQHQQFGGGSPAHLNGASPQSLSQMHMARAGMDQQQQHAMMAASMMNPTGGGGATFKLHSEGETLSRLDPSLELTKTMNNWGMTYRVPQKPQRRTWGEQTFANAQHQQQQQHHGDFGGHQQGGGQQQGLLFSPSNHQQNAAMMMADFAAANERQQHMHQQQQMLLAQQQQLQQLQQHQQLLEQAAMMQGDFRGNETSATFDNNSAAMSTVEMVPSEPEFTSQQISGVAMSPSSIVGGTLMTTSAGDIRMMRTSTDAIIMTGPMAAAAGLSPTQVVYQAEGNGIGKSSTPNVGIGGGAAASNLDASREASPGVGFVAGGENDRTKEYVLQKKKEQIMTNALRRREMMEQRRSQIDAESNKRREEKQMQEEAEEQKKKEREQHRQKIWEDYQRRKAEQEAVGDSSAASTSAAPPTPLSSRTLPRSQQQQQRNRSQPPPRPKSQVMGGKGLSGASSSLVPSGSADNLDQLDTKSQSSDGTGGSGPHATTSTVVPAEPTHKLFVKPSQKTNRNLVLNAIQYCVLAGVVNEPTKQKVLTELAKSDSKHFLLLFRDKKCQFKSLYSWDQVSDTAHKLFGLGPTTCQENFMDLMFKYDSGGKQFNQIPTKHLSAQIDGFTVKEEYWQKKKPLYSTTRP